MNPSDMPPELAETHRPRRAGLKTGAWIAIVLVVILAGAGIAGVLAWRAYDKQRTALEAKGFEALKQAGALVVTEGGIPTSVSFLNKQLSDADLENVGALYRLQALNLNHTSLRDDQLAHLGRLARLSTLELRSTPLSGKGFVHLKGLKSLTTLFLDNTKLSDEDGLAHLKPLRELRKLYMSNTGITDKGLAHLSGLPRLEDLWIGGNPGITDAAVDCLLRMHKLMRVQLGGTGVTAEGLERLKKARPELNVNMQSGDPEAAVGAIP
ncbi:MAG: leucine-rich repeat domain-containing protein [Thermoguttaceae bacterium]